MILRLLDGHKAIPLLALIGVVLDALGGLYLAYDLLGGERGPLRALSRLLTYSAIFGLGFGLTLGGWFGLAGAVGMAPTFEMQLARRARGIAPTRREWIMGAFLRGLAFGAAGWLAVGHDFGIAFGLLSGAAMHITYELGYGTTQYRSYQRPRIERKTVTGAILRGVGIGLAGVFSGAVTGRPEAFLYGVEIGLVAGTLNTTVAIISPMVEWWGEHLPDRALGGYGAVMVLIGSALQTLQYVMPLAGK
ncbi:MAG TPA: hypothetical protein VMF50_17300 [Candidatus Binataceae bacterium]|nr:hypothetical protein [Candidatus Binataceae bacterium]